MDTVENRGSIFGVLEAAANLVRVASGAYTDADPCVVYRAGLRFEKSGWSMAVYDASRPWPEGEPYDHKKVAHAKRTFLARYDLNDGELSTFNAAIDRFLMNRYFAEVA